MTKEIIDVDDEAVAELAAYYGTTSVSDIVNAALRAVARDSSVAQDDLPGDVQDASS